MTANDMTMLLSDPLFSSFGEDMLKSWLREKKITPVVFKKGDTIMSAGKFERCLVLILKGSAFVTKISAGGKRRIVSELYAGDVFGMATLFYEPDNYPSEITAESYCRMLVFPKALVEEAFAQSPEFAKAYAILLSQKIHFLNKKLGAFVENDVDKKLLQWLSAASGGSDGFILPCSVARLAEILGVGRASVYRAFSALEEEGIIAKNGKIITIMKPEQLMKY